eukprot:1061747-Rhodomonas_salina.1
MVERPDTWGGEASVAINGFCVQANMANPGLEAAKAFRIEVPRTSDTMFKISSQPWGGEAKLLPDKLVLSNKAGKQVAKEGTHVMGFCFDWQNGDVNPADHFDTAAVTIEFSSNTYSLMRDADRASSSTSQGTAQAGEEWKIGLYSGIIVCCVLLLAAGLFARARASKPQFEVAETFNKAELVMMAEPVPVSAAKAALP